MEEQDTISIDYRNIIKDLLLLRKEEQKTISINYNITIILRLLERLQKYIHFPIHNHVFCYRTCGTKKHIIKNNIKKKAQIKSPRQIQKCLV